MPRTKKVKKSETILEDEELTEDDYLEMKEIEELETDGEDIILEEAKEKTPVSLLFSTTDNGTFLSHRILSRDEEVELFERLKETTCKVEINTIKRYIVEKNQRLIYSIAKRVIKTTGGDKVSFDDLMQEGVIGLYSGLDKFDISKGFKLSTYITWYIKQKMQNFLSNNMMHVRITLHRRNEISTINRIKEDFMKVHHREPTFDEIQEITGYPDSRMKDLMNLMSGSVSLDNTLGSDDGESATFQDMVKSETDIEGDFNKREIMEYINRALNRLTPKEKKIFEMLNGFKNGQLCEGEMDLEEVAEFFGMTKEEVKKIDTSGKYKIAEELKTKYKVVSGGKFGASFEEIYGTEQTESRVKKEEIPVSTLPSKRALNRLEDDYYSTLR